MDFNLEVPRDHLFIRSISEAGIRINDDFYQRPFIISRERIVADWDVKSINDIDEAALQSIFDMQPELILIGCGKKQSFLPPAIQAHFFRRGVGFEIMITDAACRTFNVLASEGRNVVAALLPNR